MAKQKYDALTRARVWRRIEELAKQGEQSTQIAESMAAAGHKLPDGVTPMTRDYVTKVMYQIHKKAEEPGLKVTKEAPTDRLPHTVVGILTDPTLSAEQKVRMISAYADLA